MNFITNRTYQNALLFSMISGMSTGLGGLFVICFGQPSPHISGTMLAFASGVMLYVGLIELVPESFYHIGGIMLLVAIVLGFLLIHFIVKWIPQPDAVLNLDENSHTFGIRDPKLLLTGIIVVIGISIHNFPEGMAVFLSTLNGWKIGIPIAIAIGLHNFPEGMAVSASIYAATNSKYKAIKWSFISGLCEPAGAFVFGLLFYNVIDRFAVSFLLAMVSGVMSYICLKELIPNSLKYAGSKLTILGNFIGIFILYTFSILLSKYGS
jgi:ZIP family zinc transporter